MNRIASLGLLFLGFAALGGVGLLWFERTNSDEGIVHSEHELFFSRYTVEEVKQFDLFFEQYRTVGFTVPHAHQQIEWIQMIEDFTPVDPFADGVMETTRMALMTSYSHLREAYQAKLDGLAEVSSDDTVAATFAVGSAVSKAKTKSEMSAVRYLMALLAYEKLLEKESRWESELAVLITKYRNITNIDAEFKE